jgi:cysteine-rich repeat protein
VSRRASLFVLFLVWGGCLQERISRCELGFVCADGLRCGQAGDAQICVVATCGNGHLDREEACDDGNNLSGDGCPADCTAPCGDTLVDPGEACDDGNAIDGDACNRDCSETTCGNGIITSGEACDDGNAIEGDGCDSNCTRTGCGNGVVTSGEACDDGNSTSRDGCELSCALTCFEEPPTATLSPTRIDAATPGQPISIELAVTNHNPAPCAPLHYSVEQRFFAEGRAGGVVLLPSPFIVTPGAPVPSGATGHFTLTATPALELAPGTEFTVGLLVYADGTPLAFTYSLSIGALP